MRAGEDRDAMPPLQPHRNQRIEVRASSTRLGMRPITVCEYEYVHNRLRERLRLPTSCRNALHRSVHNLPPSTMVDNRISVSALLSQFLIHEGER